MSLNYSHSFTIDNKRVGGNSKTYFIADIGANHGGDLEKAKNLIYLCAEAGADAAKFQHFNAKTIVSDQGFTSLDRKYMSHQANWSKSVFEVYKSASIDENWTATLKETCEDAGITFMTTPYSPHLVDLVDEYVDAYKVGSGDITWTEHLEYIAKKNKPVILACGASTMDEIVLAVDAIRKHNLNIALLQCNTNYTADPSNFDYIHLNVLTTFNSMFPNMVIGLSDHTPGHSTALGAVALGGKIIEKHFTDDKSQAGPDHKFAMDPKDWRDMVDRTLELERALGNGVKKVELNEESTVIIQRRCVRVNKDLDAGHVLQRGDLDVLRPCPDDAFEPHKIHGLIGCTLRKPIPKGQHLTAQLLEDK